jgi:NADH dehydrogenase
MAAGASSSATDPGDREGLVNMDEITGGTPYRYLGSLVSLSDYNAFGSLAGRGLLPGRFIGGRAAQLSYASLYRMHQLALHGPWRTALLWLTDALNRLSRPSLRMD